MILLTGSTGQLGVEVFQLFSELNLEFASPTRAAMDLSDLQSIKLTLQSIKPTTIVHLAAATDVDYCEKNPLVAHNQNFLACMEIVEYCRSTGARLIFLSSSSVFGGSGKLMHLESEDLLPINAYAKSKADAENYILARLENYFIIRAGWMLGSNNRNKKFAEKMIDKIVAGEDVQASFDKYGSLTLASTLAKVIVKALVADSGKHVVHIASRTPCSRYDLAKQISSLVRGGGRVVPVEDKIFNLSAPRGLSEGLDSTLGQELLGYEAKTWEEELRDFIINYKFKPGFEIFLAD